MIKIPQLWLGIFFSSLAVLFYWLTPQLKNDLQVVFCDVGQGDATLINKGNIQILIDAGRNSRVLDCLENHLPLGDRVIELAVGTHTDSDHIGGFEMVLNRYFVKQMLISEYASKTKAFKAFREAVLREKLEGMELTIIKTNLVQNVTENLTLQHFVSRVANFENDPYLSGLPETILWDRISMQDQAMKEQGLSLNALSIVTLLQYGQVKILLTGDADIAREQALVDGGVIVDVDVLKVGHHGSKTSTSEAFLRQSQPEVAVISVGNNNSYGLPSPQVVTKIQQFGSQIFRTDRDGEVIMESDGKTYQVK